MKKNQGISLIPIIITIIIVIVLVAVAVFVGFKIFQVRNNTQKTLSRAQFADFTSQFASLRDAIYDKHNKLYKDYALEGIAKTDEQMYYQIATGEDIEETQYMSGYGTTPASEVDQSKGYQHIRDSETLPTDNADKAVNTRIGMSLPANAVMAEGWCMTKEGEVFNASGFYDEESGRTYFTVNLYTQGQLPSSSDIAEEGVLAQRAKTISDSLLSGLTGEIEVKDN